MKVIGIIAEYNPFHNGHLYHLQRAREITGADAVVVVMSGNFVQRGEPAVIDKVRRTRAALACGADVVLELPLSWATGTAERFAAGSVSILKRLNIVSGLVCGSETPDPVLAEKILDLQDRLDDSDSEEIHLLMDQGMTYPAARACLLEKLLPGAGAYLSSPNNILAFEYRKAMRTIPDCHLTLHEIPRLGNDYNETSLPREGKYASASAIRKELLKMDISMRFLYSNGVMNTTHANLKNSSAAVGFIPEAVLPFIDYAMQSDDFSSYLSYSVLSHTVQELACCQDMNPQLARRLKKIANEHPTYTFTQTAEDLKSRNITMTRANRALLHVMLGVKDPAAVSVSGKRGKKLTTADSAPAERGKKLSTADSAPAGDFPQAVRLLGMRRDTPVMRPLMDQSEIPVITKTANGPEGVFDTDIFAGRLYNRAVYERTGILLEDDFRQSPVIWDASL